MLWKLKYKMVRIHTHPFNGPFSGTTRVSQYQKGKTGLDLLKQETVSGSGISWAMCKSAPRFRQITTPAPHHSVFYRPDALPAAQPTASKHWRDKMVRIHNKNARNNLLYNKRYLLLPISIMTMLELECWRASSSQVVKWLNVSRLHNHQLTLIFTQLIQNQQNLLKHVRMQQP